MAARAKRSWLLRRGLRDVSWERSAVATDLPQAGIKSAPEYDPDSPIARDYEISLFKHYSRQGYWSGQESADPGDSA